MKTFISIINYSYSYTEFSLGGKNSKVHKSVNIYIYTLNLSTDKLKLIKALSLPHAVIEITHVSHAYFVYKPSRSIFVYSTQTTPMHLFTTPIIYKPF